MAKGTAIDIITMHLINNFLYSLVDEMATAVVRTSFSPLARDAFDFQCGICDAGGDIILEGEGSLLHSIAYKYIIEIIRKKYGNSIHSGDTFFDNDPYSEASHLPDIYMAKPIFLKGELIAWAVSGGHMVDVGGRVAGSCACDSTEIYQEGLRVPPVKLYSKGLPNQDVFDILKANSRVPHVLVGDLAAHHAACHTGEMRFLELVKEYGWKTLKRYIEELLNYSERRTREDLKALPDGNYRFTDYLDDDGFGSDLVPIHVEITVEGDSITYDFTGTSPQIKGAMNNPLATTKGMVFIALRCLISPDIPRNSGVWRAVKIIVPPGSLLNPDLPAAVAGRGATISRLIDTMLGAEAQIAPHKIPACEMGSDFLICMGFYDHRKRISSVLVETAWGGWGGRPYADGIDYNTPILLDGANQSCELNEELYPIRYNQYAYVPDTEGAGKQRGSLALVRDWELTAEAATLQIRVERTRTRPYGLSGGRSGEFSRTTLISKGGSRDLGKETFEMKLGDILRLQTAGAGGWGHPLERDAERVKNDVLNEKVTAGRARSVYGVVIDAKRMEVDKAKTRKLRREMGKEGLQ
jgi:N-methylhydantoinase B